MSPYLSRHLITRMMHYNQIYLNYHRVETLHCSFGSNVNYQWPINKIVGCYVRFLCIVAVYSLVKSDNIYSVTELSEVTVHSLSLSRGQ